MQLSPMPAYTQLLQAKILTESVINLIFTIQYQYETTEKAYKTPNITYWYSSFPQYDILAIPTPVESYILQSFV